MLRVVDLAGSERNYETQLHTRSMAERGGHINYSLLMLKECARLMHRNHSARREGDRKEQHVPFRSSRLTHLLQSCFTDDTHRTVVITTLSPSPTDVEHTLNSLQHVGMMRASRPVAAGAEEEDEAAAHCSAMGGGSAGGKASDGTGFEAVQGRGHELHSKLQDARASQLKLHAFDMLTGQGGTIQKKYDPENVKLETFIDSRWHREMKVQVEESDLWVLKEADAEIVQTLTSWRQEQWHERQAHDLVRWDAKAVQAFVASLALPGEVRLPSTMTGAQLQRLGRRGLSALCGDEATFEALHDALCGERAASRELTAAQTKQNAKVTALGAHKVHVALEKAD